jgi:hypothetical protein
MAATRTDHWARRYDREQETAFKTDVAAFVVRMLEHQDMSTLDERIREEFREHFTTGELRLIEDLSQRFCDQAWIELRKHDRQAALGGASS